MPLAGQEGESLHPKLSFSCGIGEGEGCAALNDTPSPQLTAVIRMSYLAAP